MTKTLFANLVGAYYKSNLNMADNHFPVTYAGDHRWTDYAASAQVRLDETPEGWAGPIGRAFSDGAKCTTPDAYMLYLHRPVDG